MEESPAIHWRDLQTIRYNFIDNRTVVRYNPPLLKIFDDPISSVSDQHTPYEAKNIRLDVIFAALKQQGGFYNSKWTAEQSNARVLMPFKAKNKIDGFPGIKKWMLLFIPKMYVVKSPTSFPHLRTMQGVIYKSYQIASFACFLIIRISLLQFSFIIKVIIIIATFSRKYGQWYIDSANFFF